MKVTLADKLSVYPVLQQVIGLATVVSNIVKTINDYVSCFFAKRQIERDEKLYLRFLGKKLTIREEADMYKAAGVNMMEFINTDNPKAQADLKVISHHYKISKTAKENLISRRALMNEHSNYIGIGFRRLTPILGTIYSRRVCLNGLSD